MSVELLAIKFNHNPNSARDDALNIRKNATDFVTVPEWELGMIKPEESLAAYAINETLGNKITIEALFARTDPTLTTVEVRAVHPPPPPPPPGWIQSLRRLLEIWPWLWNVIVYLFYTGYGRNVLGEVKARQITFQADGESGFEMFELEKLFLLQRGVGIHTVTWRWQFRIPPTGLWTDFAESHHKIYTVLEVPKLPWEQTPHDSGNTGLPWSEVLDYACQWAAWTYTLDDAAAHITKAVNDLGKALLTYSGSTHYYAVDIYSFLCTDFLDLLANNKGLGKTVDCSDCATIVSTFANVLGCNLSQSTMGEPKVNVQPQPSDFFETNPILSIGSSNWGPTTWNYHEVAWTGGGTAYDNVYDASLHLNNNANPAVQPYIELLPINMRFGDPNSGDYRDKLAAAKPKGNRKKCDPDRYPRRRHVK
jgi:hypothetical protein